MDNEQFFCDTRGPGRRSPTRPDSVHKLTPGDIDVIGVGKQGSYGNKII